MALDDLWRPKARGLLCILLASVVAVCLLGGSSFSQSVHAQGKADLSLTFVPSVYSIEAKAGRDSHLIIEVRNTGTTTITGIELSAASPGGWKVTLDPAEIVELSPGAVSRVSADVRPAPSVTKGEYQVSFNASAGGIERVMFLQVNVKPASYWLWLIFGIGAIVVAVFVIIFLRAGRRG
jgi:uncharacterized membrane protein